nr:MAG TPA: hypothetical protein [Caudoviricetes sp.]
MKLAGRPFCFSDYEGMREAGARLYFLAFSCKKTN